MDKNKIHYGNRIINPVIITTMEEAFRQQRANCYKALGNLPPNLKKSYEKKVMGAEVPAYTPPQPVEVPVEVEPPFPYGLFALGVAIGVTVTALAGFGAQYLGLI